MTVAPKAWRLVARVAIVLGIVASGAVVPTASAQAAPPVNCEPRRKGYQVTPAYIYVYDYVACQFEDITFPVSVSRLVPVSPPIYWNVVASGQGEIFYICNGSLPNVYKVHFGTSNPQFTANCG